MFMDRIAVWASLLLELEVASGCRQHNNTARSARSIQYSLSAMLCHKFKSKNTFY